MFMPTLWSLADPLFQTMPLFGVVASQNAAPNTDDTRQIRSGIDGFTEH
jgi:hypothetical protein